MVRRLGSHERTELLGHVDTSPGVTGVVVPSLPTYGNLFFGQPRHLLDLPRMGVEDLSSCLHLHTRHTQIPIYCPGVLKSLIIVNR